ncbi:MAG: CFI-box-CTERM domain-containing protein [Bacteroidota bacterium]
MNVKCQSCGASQNINEGEKCSFCGSVIASNEEIKNRIDNLNANGNLFKLAEVAFEGEDFEEAIKYYNKCLEIDSDFFEVWYKKAISTLRTSTLGNLKSKQTISALKQAINGSPNSEQFKKRMRKDVLPTINNYYKIAYEHYIKFKKIENSDYELIEKLNNANDLLEFLIDEIKLEVNEIKQILPVLNDLRNKMAISNLGSLLSSNLEDLNAIHSKLTQLAAKLTAYWEIKDPEGAKKNKSGCFIATAAMGNYDHPVVMDLRFFRDNWLLKRQWGIKFTNWYYTHGPKAANVIEKSKLLKSATFILVVKPLQLFTKLFR